MLSAYVFRTRPAQDHQRCRSTNVHSLALNKATEERLHANGDRLPHPISLVHIAISESMDHTQLSGSIYDLQKDPVVLGTYESSAFILSLRDSEEFHSIHSFGYHHIPHIGVYGNDYSLSLPMVLLSLPPTPSYLQRLPPDLLNALDLQEIVQKPVEVTSKTKLELFSEHVCAILQDQSGLNPELCGRIVARELVKMVILSACETVRMNGSSCLLGRGSLGDCPELRDLKEESDVSGGDLENVGGFTKWREAKRDSTVSAMSLDSETLAGGEITTVVEECSDMEEHDSPLTQKEQNGHKRQNDHKRVSVHKRPNIVVHIMDSEDDELRIAAKKLVKKVLHTACKRLESIYRRSSIEYLTASTKRMRIADSPLPPQTLLEEDPPPISPPVLTKYSKVHPQTWPHNRTHHEVSVAAYETPSFTDLLSPSHLLSNCQEGRRNPIQSNPQLQTKRPRPKDSRSPSPSESFKSPAFVEPPLSPPPLQREDSPTHSWNKLGKKRSRSESHDIMMLKELDKFRQSKLGQKLQQMTDKFSGILNPRRIAARVQSSRDQLPPLPNGGGLSVNSLASTMERMSIAEAQSESGTECDTTDEEYIVLSPVTKKPPQLEGEVIASEFDCTENVRGFQSLSATLNGTSVEAEGDDNLTNSYSGINARRHRPRAHTFDVNMHGRRLLSSQSEEEAHCRTPIQTTYGNYYSVPEMDLFVIIHTHPPPGVCQKFLCNNTNEVNLMYHCWLFPDLPFDPKVTRSDWLEVGVFEPFGVQPVHLDLQDAGVAFYFLDPRTVCVHDCRFSPENAQLQLSRGVQFHSFFSAAKHGARRVVSYHVIPANPSVELSVRECIQCCSTLGELLTKLSYYFPEVGQHLLHLISISPPKM